ncbi:MAG: hypothetical protein HOO96_40055 [Polyangiaceae bacterium]|nr:hypothetical protein [Polyangiaceae bacterium]
MRTCLQLALGLTLFACAAPRPPVAPPNADAVARPVVRPASAERARKDFDGAREALLAHDRVRDWNDAACDEIAGRFDALAMPEATFNAGLAVFAAALQGEAKRRFEKALRDAPQLSHARAELVLYEFRVTGDLDAAIAALEATVRDAGFQNVAALVNLAALQMQRSGPLSGDGCTGDVDCAKQNVQRALAIDDAFMPAYNRLALLYLAQARRAGTADVQRLELAALVCSQAIRKNASYAPIHNTAGLVQHELGRENGAVASFGVAAALDPRLFEAQMNYAAANLSFRGFEEAQKGYQKALAIRPGDYDAHLGLALALRGRIDHTNHDAQVAAVRAELEAAKRIDVERPDAFYNEAILVEEYESKGRNKAQTIAGLSRAQALLASFIEKATGKPAYDGAVQRAKERIEDMETMKTFIQGAGTFSGAPRPPRPLPSPYGPSPAPQPSTPPATPLPLPSP